MNNTRRDLKNSNRLRNKSGATHTIIGLVVVLVGMGLLFRELNIGLPGWLFGWEMILIVVGIITGVKNQFKDISSLIMILVGCIFLSNDIFPNLSISRFLWPAAIIIVGVVIAFKSRIKSSFQPNVNPEDGIKADDYNTSFVRIDDNEPIIDNGEVLDITAVFGGAKRSLVTKNLLGGELTAVLGGVEINMTNSDIKSPIKIECTSVLGGIKLVIPSNWDVRSEITAVFGGVDDKRVLRPEMIDSNKQLILIGTCFMGGIEIKSY